MPPGCYGDLFLGSPTQASLKQALVLVLAQKRNGPVLTPVTGLPLRKPGIVPSLLPSPSFPVRAH